jgi:hypothetical protein
MDYEIVALFPEKINKDIEKLKREIAKLGPKSEVNIPPFLSLRKGLDVPNEKIDEIISGFSRFIKDIRPIEIKTEGYDFISNISDDPWIKSTFLISLKVIKTKDLDELNNKLNEFRLFGVEDKDNEEAYIPRIIVAKDDLDNASFKRVKTFLKDKKIDIRTNIDNITFLLKKSDGYIIYKRFNV